jgi:23S rRNA (pseudouridine1915-N3)-methyltransferase
MTPVRFTFICVGRLSREYQAVWRHYEGLLRPYCALEVLEVNEAPLSSRDDNARVKDAAALLGLLRKGAYTIALDARGQQHSSEELSAFLAGKKLYGQSHFQFLLGGAAGLDPRVLEVADHRWSLSRLTFPHQMARCIVLEQVYRAIRIERGEPYHH